MLIKSITATTHPIAIAVIAKLLRPTEPGARQLPTTRSRVFLSLTDLYPFRRSNFDIGATDSVSKRHRG
jgi:hypothetical protein